MDLTITIAERKRTASVVERVSYLLGFLCPEEGRAHWSGVAVRMRAFSAWNSVSLSAPVWRSWASARTCRMRMAIVRSSAAGAVRLASWAWICWAWRSVSRPRWRRLLILAVTSFSDRNKLCQDFFCLTPSGVSVGHAPPTLLNTLTEFDRHTDRGTVVWASTSSAYYADQGVRVGATLTAAKAKLPRGNLFRIGLNYWYVAPAGAAAAVLKVRGGVVPEVGIAVKTLTRTKAAQQILLTGFS